MLFTAIRDIWAAFRQYTDQAIKYAFIATSIYLVISLITFIVRSIKGQRPHSIWYVLFKTCLFAVFGIYLSYLVALTFSSRVEGSRVGLINLVPLKRMFQSKVFMLEGLENIALFFPFGFLIPCVFKYFRGIFRTSLMGFSLSLIIEITQLVTSRGFFDIDDIILNSLGSFVGYLVFSGIYDGLLAIKRRILIDISARLKSQPPLGKLYNRFALRNPMILFLLQAFPVVLWANIIMGFSNDTGEQSGRMSKLLLGKIFRMLGLARNIGDEVLADSESFLFLEKVLRKMAHMFEYGVLALLTWACIYSIVKLMRGLSYGAGLALAFIVGMIDETNQKGVLARTGTYKDVIWDMSGAILFLLVIAIIVSLAKRHYLRKYSRI